MTMHTANTTQIPAVAYGAGALILVVAAGLFITRVLAWAASVDCCDHPDLCDFPEETPNG